MKIIISPRSSNTNEKTIQQLGEWCLRRLFCSCASLHYGLEVCCFNKSQTDALQYAVTIVVLAKYLIRDRGI